MLWPEPSVRFSCSDVRVRDAGGAEAGQLPRRSAIPLCPARVARVADVEDVVLAADAVDDEAAGEPFSRPELPTLIVADPVPALTVVVTPEAVPVTFSVLLGAEVDFDPAEARVRDAGGVEAR